MGSPKACRTTEREFCVGLWLVTVEEVKTVRKVRCQENLLLLVKDKRREQRWGWGWVKGFQGGFG